MLALTGGVAGEVGRHLVENRPDAARISLDRLKGIFPGRLYVEIQRHGLPQENQIEEALIELAYATDLPLVATNDVFFSDEGMFAAHDALLCIAQGSYVDNPDRRRVTQEHRFKSAREMRELFRDLPEAIDKHAGDRPALRLHAAGAQADPAGLRGRRGRDRPRCARRRARDWSCACRRSASRAMRASLISSGWSSSSASSSRWASPAIS